MKTPIRVLFVEDSPDDLALVMHALRKAGYEFVHEHVTTRSEMLDALGRRPWDLILSDYHIPGFGGMDVLALRREERLDVPLIMVTGEVGEAQAVEAMRAGAADWISKDNLGRLGPAVARELEEAALRRDGRAAAEWLEAERHFTSAILDTAGALVMVLGTDGKIRRVNRAFERTTGYPTHELLGRAYWDVFLEAEAAQAERLRFLALTPGSFPRDHEAVWPVPGTAPRTIAWTETAILGPGDAVAHVIWTGIDVTEKKRLQEKLAHDALHDALTGLGNRALFLERLGHRLRHFGRHPESVFAVLYLDLDRFKGANDNLGHEGGDRLLRAVAERLLACMRPSDTLARLGGDEFAVLLEEVTDVSGAARVADRIRQALAEPISLSGHEISTSASIGIALSTSGYSSPESMLRDADTAMYRAKSRGRGRYEVFDQAMRERAQADAETEADLRRALGRGELRVFYQPVVAVGDETLAGFEALVRWDHPRRGLVLPGEFIPVAEENGLITELDRRVMAEACHQLKEWQERFGVANALSVSVNLSGRHFSQPEAAGQIRRVLADSGLPASALNLEITESVLLESTEQAKQLLWDLRLLGARVHLDDFGTGYASLNYLRALPVSALKIDRSFIASLGGTRDGEAIVRAIVTLAHNLELKVVAEGVETEGQLAFLRALGCDYAQGYRFSRPLPTARAEMLLAQPRSCWPFPIASASGPPASHQAF